MLAARGLVEQGADFEPGRVAGFEDLERGRKRVSGIDDVLDQQDVAAGDLALQILEEADLAAGDGRVAVGGGFEEIDPIGRSISRTGRQ